MLSGAPEELKPSLFASREGLGKKRLLDVWAGTPQ